MSATATSINYKMEHNVGGASIDINIGGRKQTIRSPWMNDDNKLFIQSDIDEVTNICDKVISSLWTILSFSSWRVNSDQITQQFYSEEDANKYLVTSVICGSQNMQFYPNNSVTHHVDSKWLMRCLNIYYRVSKAYIPNYYNNFPTKMKIPRSNGTTCDAIIWKNGQIRLHQSKTLNDSTRKFYIRANFFTDGASIEEEYPEENSSLWSFKDAVFEDVCDLNKITEVTFNFTDLFTDEEINAAIQDNDLVKMNVMLYFNNLHYKWVENELMPVIKNTPSIKITIV